MNINLSDVNLSGHDKRLGITLPSTLTPELAEFIGIVIGDGHLSQLRRSNSLVSSFTQSTLFIAGCREEDLYLRYICNLFKSLFSCVLS